MSYVPTIDDYIRWNHNGHVDEGWVYFVGDEYLTIEVSVKDKPDELVNIHKKIHCLVVCHHWYWNELEYIKNRRKEYVYSDETLMFGDYKSQEYRYSPSG